MCKRVLRARARYEPTYIACVACTYSAAAVYLFFVTNFFFVYLWPANILYVWDTQKNGFR